MKSKVILSKKIILYGIISVLVAVVISILLNNDIFLDTDYEVSYEMPYEEKLEIFAPICESNFRKMSNTEGYTDHGSEVCRIYISTSEDNDLRKQILDEVQKLSDEICAGCQTENDKVKAIAYWVSDNIFYNETAAWTSVDSDTISLETVLKLKATTCAGYSNIFSALCGMQGIYCLNLRGGTVYDGEELEALENAKMNHEWNAALADGKWVYVDTTWISKNTYYNDEYHKADYFDDKYFDMSMEFMSFEHRIDLIDHRDFKNALDDL